MLAIRIAVAVCAILPSVTTAQRTTAKLSWKKHEVAVEYGAVRVGGHSLSDLPIGGDWRLGMNEASQIRLSVPLVAGDTIAAPGSYRVKIFRPAEDQLQLLLEGSGYALGMEGANLAFDGTIVEPQGKPSKKLEIAWTKPAAKKPNCESTLEVRFGETGLDVPVMALATMAQKGKSFTATAFAWPSDVVNSRAKRSQPTPIAVVRPKRKPKNDEPDGYNLVIEGESAKLIPLMAAPTDSFGFGAVQAPSAAHVIEGEVQWSDFETKEPGASMEVVKFSATKKSIELQFVAGARAGTAAFRLER